MDRDIGRIQMDLEVLVTERQYLREKIMAIERITDHLSDKITDVTKEQKKWEDLYGCNLPRYQ